MTELKSACSSISKRERISTRSDRSCANGPGARIETACSASRIAIGPSRSCRLRASPAASTWSCRYDRDASSANRRRRSSPALRSLTTRAGSMASSRAVAGVGETVEAELVVGAGAVACGGGGGGSGGDRQEWGDRRRGRWGEIMEAGGLFGPVAGQTVAAERVDPLTVDADLQLA